MIFKTKKIQEAYNIILDIREEQKVEKTEGITAVIIKENATAVINATNLSKDQTLRIIKELNNIEHQLWKRIFKAKIMEE